jgi:hypothetical protein
MEVRRLDDSRESRAIRSGRPGHRAFLNGLRNSPTAQPDRPYPPTYHPGVESRQEAVAPLERCEETTIDGSRR